MRHIVNSNKFSIKKLTNDVLQDQTIDKILKIDVQKQKKTILELEMKLVSLNAVNDCTEERLEGC